MTAVANFCAKKRLQRNERLLIATEHDFRKENRHKIESNPKKIFYIFVIADWTMVLSKQNKKKGSKKEQTPSIKSIPNFHIYLDNKSILILAKVVEQARFFQICMSCPLLRFLGIRRILLTTSTEICIQDFYGFDISLRD